MHDPTTSIKAILSNLHSEAITVEKATQDMIAVLADPRCTLINLHLYLQNISNEGLQAIAQALPHCTLTHLGISINNIDLAGVQAIAHALKDPRCKLTCLGLYHTYIGDAGAQVLAHALIHPHCTLTKLDLANIGREGAIALFQALPHCKLTDLELSGNNDIGRECAIALSQALKDPHCTLTKLDLANIGRECAIALSQALPHCKLTDLELSGNNDIGPEGAQALAEALKDPRCTLAGLKLYNIGREGVQAFAQALKDPDCTLTFLGLYHTYIDDAGAKALAHALIHPHCTLIQLDFLGNNIGLVGAKAIAAALIHPNCTLTQLGLWRNNIGLEGAQALAHALIHPHCTLTQLGLWSNNIGAAGIQALAEALKTNRTLTSLALAQNYITDAGAQVIADALKTNTTLTSLDLRYNKIADAGAQALAHALIHPHCTLTCLDLRGNNIGDAGKQALFNAALACAQKGRLITITGAYSSEQAQQIQETYNEVLKLTKSLQRLAVAKAQHERLAYQSPAYALSQDLTEMLSPYLTASNHFKVVQRTKEELKELPKQSPVAAHTTLSIKQCLLSLGLGLATSAFIAHAFGVTGSTESILSTPFAMSLTVGACVTRLAFCAASSCMPVCRPNTRTAASSETLSSAHAAAGAAPTDASRQHTHVALEGPQSAA